jgi:adenylate cyclase, class 2
VIELIEPSNQELEVKFYVPDLAGLQARLEAAGAQLVHPRVRETNLRFDTPSGELTRSYRVLRLRQDAEARLTYKGPGREQDGVRARLELEFSVSDFNMARRVLEALGYEISVMYEKYRATYSLGGALVTLDEMPYGNFIEIEGPDGASIQQVAETLGVDWEARILDSYLVLFDRLRAKLGLKFQYLSFTNFEGVTVTGEMLGVRGAVS